MGLGGSLNDERKPTTASALGLYTGLGDVIS
jgi:hypothetical protein